ncbi:site-2 protease family protein [Leptospira sp. GIMC2001]|uniref:site-2 protease family protein n=1 Tax=Leptospira sp. GIMC2001 TaxID=1513297 RepID=UPI00234A08B3|nr:site-2 protease family protein [Leptospira sp. GIMC2001]WCL48730.1 site-2 protease family protein [Leptospira sp. GIMC2001]
MLILILGAVMMLAVSIFIHELGHLLCGMLVGVKARIFSMGYGRGIWKKKIGETTYQITAIPLGGYVMFKGDEYGRKLKGEPGELLSTPPLKRMIPVLGGPFANLVLGFLLLFLLEMTGDNAPGNKIFIDPSIESISQAYKSGLKSGDIITAINGEPTANFEDIFTNIALSKGDPIEIQYNRNGKEAVTTVIPNMASSGGRPSIGIEPAGERRVVATFTYSEQITEWLNQKLNDSGETDQFYKEQIQERIREGEIPEEVVDKIEAQNREKELKSRAVKYLNDGDVLISVNGVDVQTITDLQTELGKYRGKQVDLKLIRKTLPLLTPWAVKDETVTIPVLGADVIELKNLKHAKYPELNVEGLSIASYDPDIENKLKNIQINGNIFENIDSLISYIKSAKENSMKVSFSGREYLADVAIRPIGLLGFRPSMKFVAETRIKDQNLGEAFASAGIKVYQNVSTTLKGIGMLFSGLLSPKENLSGPIGIVHIAGLSLEYGWRTYLDLVAKISIALMIMNLLPIPIADGGHIVMYAYEAVVGRPLPKRVMEAIFRIGFFFLIGLGIFVSFNDILRFF